MIILVQIVLISEELFHFFRHIVVRCGLSFAILELTLWYGEAEAFAVTGKKIAERRYE